MSDPTSPPTVPLEYCGKWIAWDYDETRIVAAGNTYLEAKRAAEELGEKRPVLAKAPPADARFIGGYR